MQPLNLTLQNAINLHQNGQVDEAAKAYRTIILEQPDCYDAYHLLAILYAEQGDYEEAIAWLNKLIDLGAVDYRIQEHLGRCYAHLKQFEQAEAYYLEALRIGSEPTSTYGYLAGLYREQGLSEAAEKIYQTLVQREPANIEMHFALGELALIRASWEEAKQYFFQVTVLSPGHQMALFHLGSIAYQKRDLQQAYAYYSQVNTDPDARLNLAVILLEQGYKQEAIEAFKALLNENPNNLLAHSNLASMALIDKDYETAMFHYQAILSQDLDNYTAHFNLGAIYMALKKWEMAGYHLAIGVRIQPNDPDVHDNYATVLLKLQQQRLAEHHYEIALSLRPEDPIASFRLAALQGTQPPERAPDVYVQSLFDNYAEHFDYELMEGLQYKVPEALYREASRYFFDRWDLDILDLGCGTGLCGPYFSPRSKQLIGIDLSEQMLALAEKKNCYQRLIQGEMTQVVAGFKEAFDLIIAADSLVYLGELAPLFIALYQALKPGGYCLFTVERSLAESPYSLGRSGRYSHRQDYLLEVAKSLGFEVDCHQSIVLRQERGEPVYGWLMGWVRAVEKESLLFNR